MGRLLSFLDTASFDDVRRTKERYEHPAIELVVKRDGVVVGLMDIECEEAPGTVCEERPGLGGMIWHLAVHPDHQRQGIASELLREAERAARVRVVERFEAWPRDDEGTRAWYDASAFGPPAGFPAAGRWQSRWDRVAADPEPFLGLELCSQCGSTPLSNR